DVPLEELELATVKYAYREDRTPARAARHIPRIVMEGGWVEQRLPVVVGRLTCDTLEVRVQEGAFLHADPATAPAMLADLVSIGDRVLFRVLSGSAEHACIESVAVGVTARVDPAASPALRRAVDMVRSTL
ncbi:MAG: hypothetical protein KC656_20475, partial [Myxococcales bacterium]|nr:hypothetical protein [Myxococcales bacterium]